MNPYNYSSNEPHYNLRLKETTSKWLRYTVKFPSAHPTRHEEHNTVRGEYLRPLGVSQAPLAILIHGWGDHSVIPCKLLAKALVKRGIACFILYLVFHSDRMPEVIKIRRPALTLEEWFEGYQVSVVDVRQVVDWAGGREEIDNKQIAAIGTSLGGFISAIAMGIDKRIKAGVFIIAGGNSEKMMWLSRTRAMKKGYNRTESEYQDIQNSYAQYLAEVAEKGFENVNPPRKSFLTDPMTFASYLRQRPILMLNALWDEFVPRQAVLDFWEACGKPAISWFPTTHASIWLLYPLISRKTVHFLMSTFDMQGRSA